MIREKEGREERSGVLILFPIALEEPEGHEGRQQFGEDDGEGAAEGIFILDRIRRPL